MSEITSSSIGHISDVLAGQQLSDQPKKQNNRRKNNAGSSASGNKSRSNRGMVPVVDCKRKLFVRHNTNALIDSNRQPKKKSDQPPVEPAKPAATEESDHESEDDENAKHCFICTDKITIGAIFPCNHVTCHKCTLRIRGLMKNKHCTQCRTDRSDVIFSRNLDKQYQDFTPEDIVFTHTGLGMSFDSRETQDKVLGLLKFNCPKKGCGVVAGNWKELKNHVHDAHHLRFCNLCTRHKHQLTIEFPLYNARELSKHEREGDSHGFKGHPRCNFCNVRYYSDDELFEHLKMDHEKCHICSRINPSKPQYFNDYNALEQHFREAHYACMVQSCVDLKFVVFADEIDLKAHMVEAHPGLYGNVKTARSLNVDFQSQLSTVDSRANSSGNNNKRNKPRAEGDSAEASSSSLSNQGNAFPALGGAKRSQFSSLSPSFGKKNTAAASAAPADSPAEVARRRLDERVRSATNYDASKFAQFTDLLALFTNTKIDAAKLISEIKRLVPELGAPEVLEAVIGDLVKVYSNRQAKAHALKKVLEELQLKTQFPSLGSKSAFGGLPTASGAWVSSSGAAGNVAGISSRQNRETAFPSLPSRTSTPSSASSKGKGMRVTYPVSASAPISRNGSVKFSTLSGSSLRSATVSNRTSPSTSSINLSYANGGSSSKSSSSTSLKASEFPSLPVAKPTRISSPMQLKPREVEVDDGLKILRPSRDNQGDFGSSGSNSNKKGKGRKKELLFHIG